MAIDAEVHLIPATTHGRILVRHARAAAARGLLIGFHGYMENASTQMDRLAGIPGASGWTLVSIQGLNRFYRGRTQDTVAGWMTRQDRELAIADNLGYVDAALEAVPHDEHTPLVHVGFSQGVAMAFRAAVRGRGGSRGVIAVGADVPPELLADPAARFPAVLLARGTHDTWLARERFEADSDALERRGVTLTVLPFEGAHEWNGVVSSAAGAFLASL
jgi:predicted esterase